MILTLKPETEARLRVVADRKGVPPEEVADAAIEAMLNKETGPNQTLEPPLVQDTPEQAQMRAALFEVIAKAQALVPGPRRENPEQATEEQLCDNSHA